MPAEDAGSSVEMGNVGCRENLIKVNGMGEKFKEFMFIVVKYILAVAKNICKRKLFVWYHKDATPFWWTW